MKKLILILLFIIIFILTINKNLYSQFILNSHYNPSIGDTLKTFDIDTTGLEPGEGGANRIWNFSNIVVLQNLFFEAFVLPSSTPYVSQFPNSNIASVNNNIPPLYHYYQTIQSDWNMLGYAYPNFLSIFTNPACRFHFPLTYGSQYSTTYYGIQNSGQITEYKTGFKSFNVDGYGTIILPSGTYNDVMRVKIIDETYDTIKNGGIVINTRHTLITYHWWFRNGYKFPILNMGLIESNSSPNFKVASVAIDETPVNINQISSEVPGKYFLFQNFPNPFNTSSKIKFQIKNTGFAILKIYDTIGKEIATIVDENLQAGEYTVYFESTKYQMNSGVYFYTLESCNFKDTKKMMLLK